MSQDSSAPPQDEAGQPTQLAHAPAASASAPAAPHQLAFLAEASRVLAESLEYTTTLERVARLAVPVLADWCVIDLLEDEGGSRRVAVAHVDPAQEAVSREVRRRYPDAQHAPASIAAHVMRTGQPIVVHDISVAHLQAVAHDAEHLQLLLDLGPKADMCLPLIARGHLLGTISFRLVQTARRYTTEDLLLAEELARRAALAVDNARLYAAQASIALENARLFEESTQRHAWLMQVLDMNKRLATSADMPSLLSRIAEAAARLVGAEGATLRIRHGDALVTTRQTQYGLVLPHLPALRLGEGIAGIAARDNRIVMVPDLQTHPDLPAFFKAQAAAVGLQAMISLPIQSRHSVLGVLSVHAARPRVFTDDECAALAICAEQAAIAIEHTQLVAEVQARQAELEHTNSVLCCEIEARQRAEAALALRIEQIEAVRTIAAELTQELSLPTLLELILRRAVECVDAATEGVILLWDTTDQVLIPHACRGYGAWEVQLRTVRLQLGESLSGTVAQRRQGLIVNDYQRSPYVHSQTLMAHLGYTAAMAEPLLYRDRLVGVILLTNGGTRQPFTDRDRELLTLLASHATIAIENARLFAESTRRQTWLASILDINKRIATRTDREHLMARIAEEATHLLGADGAMVRVRQADHLVATPHTCYGPALAAMMDLHFGEALARQAIREDRAIVSADIQADATICAMHKAQAAAVGLHAVLTMPIRGSRGSVGTLQVLSCRPRPFAPDEVAALSAYAEQAAMAIENARLLAAEAERTRALERTNATLHQAIAARQRVEAQREQLMAELEARHAEMERFTYTVSHDLKSPLITIRGFLGLLEQDVLGGDLERMKTDMHYIQGATATMQHLLDELLELAQIGHVANPLTEVPLSELAREAVTLVGGQLVARGVQVHIRPHLPVVRGDRPRLLAVLQNLVDNAIKFMGTQPAPRIEIGARQEREQTICYVQDNGVGIEPQYHEKVFGLFERLEVSSGGTGMGLALVKRILEVHGGRIWVESAGQGHGSTFCFILPLPGEGSQRTS
jgi:GAF domain-containing protein